MKEIIELTKLLNLNFNQLILLIILIFIITIGYNLIGKGLKYATDNIVNLFTKKEVRKIKELKKLEDEKLENEKIEKMNIEMELKSLLINFIAIVKEQNCDRKFENRKMAEKIESIESILLRKLK